MRRDWLHCSAATMLPRWNCGGQWWIKGMQRRSLASARCTAWARVSRRTTQKQLSGIDLRQIRTMRRVNVAVLHGEFDGRRLHLDDVGEQVGGLTFGEGDERGALFGR